MKKIGFLVRQILQGKSITRSFLNYRLSYETLTGSVIDIGGGKNADYLAFMSKDGDVVFETFDIKSGATVDFEKDRLPAEDGTYDTVLFLNVMEHIFNHQHIANEVMRITKSHGQLIGFVPFLMWYHADHRDFFRYTHEALEIICKRAGATHVTIEPVAHGPFTAGVQMISQLFPAIISAFIFLLAYTLDVVYLRLKPAQKGRYALGYYFKLTK